jgi:hypothetical protein
MRSADVLAILDSKGIRIHRETLARVSDKLCLPTRPPGSPPGTVREWTSQHVDELEAHFQANGWTPMMPMRRRQVADSNGPFRTRDVLAFLEGRGFSLHRDTLARISDALGLRTRDEEAPTVQREWSRTQVDQLLEHLRARRPRDHESLEREDVARLSRLHRRVGVAADSVACLTAQDVYDVVEADPSLAEQLLPFVDALLAARRGLTAPSGPATDSRQANRGEEAA